MAVPAAVPPGRAGPASPAQSRLGGSALPRVAVVALLLVVLGVVGLVQGTAAERLAREYAVTGVRAEVAEVWTYAEWRRDGTTVVDAEVVLGSEDQELVALLAGLRPEVTTTEVGWWPAATGTRYAAPLPVLHLPGDPTSVMAVADVEHHLAYAPTTHLLLVALGLVPSLLLLLVRLRVPRPAVPVAPPAAPQVATAPPPASVRPAGPRPTAPPPVIPTPRAPERADVAPPRPAGVTWLPAAPQPATTAAPRASVQPVSHPTPQTPAQHAAQAPPLPGTRRARRALEAGLVDAPHG